MARARAAGGFVTPASGAVPVYPPYNNNGGGYYPNNTPYVNNNYPSEYPSPHVVPPPVYAKEAGGYDAGQYQPVSVLVPVECEIASAYRMFLAPGTPPGAFHCLTEERTGYPM